MKGRPSQPTARRAALARARLAVREGWLV